jgi:hypothetical protein
MDKLHFERTDYSVVVKNRGTASELLEVGDLSCREIKPDKAIIGLFSHHGDRQSGRKRGAQAALGQAPCKSGSREVTQGVVYVGANGEAQRSDVTERAQPDFPAPEMPGGIRTRKSAVKRRCGKRDFLAGK